MLPDIKNFPVNWVDGMKISSQDFILLETAMADTMRDVQATRLNDFNYGLLPTNHPEIDNYPKLVYDYVNNVLVLKECRALTPGGQRLEITEVNHTRRKFPAQLPSVPVSVQEAGRYDVYVRVDNAIRVGAGDFAQNNPPRHTSVSPQYELSVRPHDGTYIEQENFLKISELEIREGRVDILTQTGKYIPPCASLTALATLLRLHGNGEERLKALIRNYSNLVNRMGADTRNEMAQEAISLAEKLVTPLVSSLNYYRHVLPGQAPLFTIVYYKDYASYVRFQLDRPYRAEIINQFRPAILELTATLDRTEPRHAAIRLSFERIMQFLEELETFLAELSKYNYLNRAFDLYDHNQFANNNKPLAAASPPVVNIPPLEKPAPPPVEIKRPERIF